MSAIKKQSNRSMHLAGLTFGMTALLPLAAMAAPHETSSQPERLLITTQGHGEVRVRPDSLRVEIGIEAQAESLEQARDEANQKAQSILEALRKLQIPGLSLRTQALELTVVRATPRGDELPKVVGYRAVNSMSATLLGAPLDELGSLGARIVDAAVGAGANVVGSIGFFVKDVRGAQDQALAAAVKDAQRNAKIMAKAAGVRLLGLHALDGAPSFQGGFKARALEMAIAPSTPIEVGEMAISSNVSVRFAFRNK